MECGKAHSLMMKHMDRTITKRESDALGEHAAKCAECSESLRLYDEILDEFKTVELCDAPSGFEAAVMGKIETLDFSHKHPAVRAERIIGIVFGVISIVIAAAFILIANKDALLEYMSGVPALSGFASFLRPLAAMTESYFNNFFSVFNGAFSNVASFLSSNKYIFAVVTGVLGIALIFLSVRKKDRIEG